MRRRSCFEGETLTYSQLDRRANQLAHLLQQQGVGPDSLVGLCMERSVEMVVGLLGILKAGGAYVALDPSYPAERLEHMRDDAGMSVVLTQNGSAGSASRNRCGDGMSGSRCGANQLTVTNARSGLQHPSRRSGLCSVHIGFDRQTQGCDEQPSEHLQSSVMDAGKLGSGSGSDRVWCLPQDDLL